MRRTMDCCDRIQAIEAAKLQDHLLSNMHFGFLNRLASGHADISGT